MKKLLDNLIYFLARCAFAFVQALSLDATLQLARVLGRVVWWILPAYRATSLKNLDIAYGDSKTKREKKDIAIRAFQHFVSVTMELLHLPRVSCRPDFWDHVQMDGIEHLKEALARNKGVIFATGHTGSWEVSGFVSKILDIPFVPVARPMDRGAKVNEYMMDLRRRSGMKIVYKHGALRTMVRALKDGAALAFIMDQNAGRAGVPTKFFGRWVSSHPSAAAMAVKFDAPVVAAYSYRTGKGFNYRVRFEPIIEMVKTGDDASDLQENTQRIMTRLESFVRAHPEQWLWAHRRWLDMRKKSPRET